jgi:hypothetical protein
MAETFPQPVYAELRAAFFAVLEEALPIIKERLAAAPPDKVQRRTYVRESDTQGSFPVVEGYDVSYYLFRAWNVLISLPSLATLQAFLTESSLDAAMLVDAGHKRITGREPQLHWLLNLYVLPLLIDYIGQDLITDWDEARAARTYQPLEAFLRAEALTWLLVAPLSGARGTDFNFDFGDDLKLRLLTPAELDSLWRTSEFGGFIDRHSLMGLKFCLEYRTTIPKDSQPDHRTAREAINDVVTSLRLVGAERVAAPDLLQGTVERTFGLGFGGGMTSSGERARLGSSDIDVGVCAQAQDVARRLTAARKIATLRLALRRFDFASQRLRVEDRLIDAWIALEALFLPGERDELRYRVSLRMAYFLSADAVERRTTFQQVRRSYDARSAIVHGHEPAQLNETATYTVEVLRRALLKAIEEPDSVSADRLDELIIGGS